MGWKKIWARLAPKVISLSTSMEGTSPYIVEKSDAISSGDKDTLRNIQDKEGSLARKAAAAQLGLAVAPQILPVIANPATASTTAGAIAATGLDAAGLVGGLSQLNNYWNNRKNLTWNDTPGIILSGLSLVPGSSQLTNPRNWAVAANTIKSINPAFRYRTLLERVKTNPELAPYYDDAASAKIKFTLKNDGNYNPDTHTVELPIFGNNRTIAHEMGHAGLRGGELDIPNYDYDGTGLNKPNESAADWFAGNLNERYYGKDAVMQARQNAVDNFDIIRHSLADGTLRFGEPTTYNGVHQSSKSIQQFEFPYQRWDVINHSADPNGAFFTLDNPVESGFLAKRPYTSYWEIKSQKPLIQIGEIRGPGNTKNNVRNAIVDYARRNGADVVEFRGIADNNLQNQNILFATDKSGIRLKYESPVTEEISIVPREEFMTTKQVIPGSRPITKVTQQNGKIRLRLPSHTDAQPREVVLDPQGNNKFYAHIRTWDGDHIPASNLSSTDKQALYDALYNEIPAGGEILLPQSGPGNYATRGTIAGLQRLARDSRFKPTQPGSIQYVDKDGIVKTFDGTGFMKKFKYESPVIEIKKVSLKEPIMAPRGMASLQANATNPYKIRRFESISNIKDDDIIKHGDRVLNASIKSVNSRLKSATEPNMIRRLKYKLNDLEEYKLKFQDYKNLVKKYRAYVSEMDDAIKNNQPTSNILKRYWGTDNFDDVEIPYTYGVARHLNELENHLFGLPRKPWYKQGGILKAQNGFLNTWQKAYNSKFGKGLRSFLNGTDSDLSDEEYLEKHGYNKPVGSIGILGALVAPEWEGLEALPVAENFGRTGTVKAVPKTAQMRPTKIKNFEGIPQVSKVGPVKEVTKFEKFLQRPIKEQDDIVRFWNGEKFSNMEMLKLDKKAYQQFKNWINK